MLITIISSLLSGLIGIFISSLFYSNLEKKKLKIDTAKRLFGYRYDPTGEGFTIALNEASIVFADSKEVIKTIEELYITTGIPGKPDINNKLLSLLKSIGASFFLVEIPQSSHAAFFIST